MNKILQLAENALAPMSKGLQSGRMSGLWYFFEGTNEAGVTATLADLGEIVIKLRGDTIINRSVSILSKMQDLNSGALHVISNEGARFFAGIFVPFHVPGLPQSLNITGEKEIVAGYNPSTGGGDPTQFADLQVTVKSEEGYKTLPERYVPFILSDDVDASGASSKPYPLDDTNIIAVYLEDESSVVTSIAYKNNNGQIQDSQSWDELYSSTLKENQLEDSDIEIAEIQMYSEGEPSSYLNTKNVLELSVNGSAVVTVTKWFIAPNELFGEWLRG